MVQVVPIVRRLKNLKQILARNMASP
jgi:hypothetical protein